MDWANIAGQLIKAGFPVIGNILAGPLGGAAGGMIGSIIASALGVEDTPEAVGTAISTGDPATVNAALARAEAEITAKWDTIKSVALGEIEVQKLNVSEVNATMRAEMRPGDIKWWHWRHLLGYAVLAWIVCPLPIILWLMLRGDITTLNAVVAALVSLIPLIGIAAGLNGFVARDNSWLKALSVTGEAQPTITSTIVKAITPAKKK